MTSILLETLEDLEAAQRRVEELEAILRCADADLEGLLPDPETQHPGHVTRQEIATALGAEA